jgi:hypothetical protein
VYAWNNTSIKIGGKQQERKKQQQNLTIEQQQKTLNAIMLVARLKYNY